MFDGQNMGSFGQSIGGGSSIAEAMQRRGMGAGILQQQSPAAPTAMPMPQRPEMAAPAGPQGAPAPAAAPQGGGEAQLIIKALSDRLKVLGQAQQPTPGGIA